MSRIEALQSQVDILSKELASSRRRTRAAFVLLGAVGILVAARPSDVVRAERIELVDGAGNVEGSWTAESYGSKMIIGEGGREQITLDSWGDGANVVVSHHGGVREGRSFQVSSGPHGATMSLRDSNDVPRISMGVRDESESVEVMDASGTMRTRIGSAGERAQDVTIGDPDVPGIAVRAEATGTAVDLGQQP